MRSRGALIRAYLPYCDEEPTGLLRFSSQLVSALNQQGADVHLLVGQLKGRPDWVASSRATVVLPNGVLRARMVRPLAVIIRIFWLQVLYPLLTRKAKDATLLLLAHESAPFPAWRQISIVHDLTALKSFAGRDGFMRRLQHRVWLSGLRHSKHIVTVSDATRRDLLALYPELAPRCTTILEGVDRVTFNDSSGPQDEDVLRELGIRRPYLLYAGTLARHKNVQHLIPVLARLVRAGDDVTLVLSGNHTDSDRADLRALANAEGVGERIVFAGYVEDVVLAALMRQCTAFVFPSLNEGFGLAPLEAMSCGAAVVSSAAGSLPEVLHEGGLLLDPNDSEGWFRTLHRLIDDADYRCEIRARGVARAKELSWTSAATRYLALLDRFALHG